MKSFQFKIIIIKLNKCEDFAGVRVRIVIDRVAETEVQCTFHICQRHRTFRCITISHHTYLIDSRLMSSVLF